MMKRPEEELPRGFEQESREVAPRLAASVIALRGRPFEVLLMRRNATVDFVPGAWVFPGGTVDEGDIAIARALGRDDTLTIVRICALRELFEESGVWLGDPLDDGPRCRHALLAGDQPFESIFIRCSSAVDELVLTSHWITPVGLPKRYDTYFFLAPAGDDVEATPEHLEGVEMLWIRPADALERFRSGTLPLVFPTIKNLEALTETDDPERLLESRRGREIPVIQPEIVERGGRTRIVIPAEETSEG